MGRTLQPVRELLTGNHAFYNKPDYLESTRQEFACEKALPVSFQWTPEDKTCRVSQKIFRLLRPLYLFPQKIAGKIIIISSSPEHLDDKESPTDHRKKVALDTVWKYKRITIGIENYKIDTVIFGKEETLGNGTWTLVSNGNATFYEKTLAYESELTTILAKIKSNAIVWNYPGVGASTGSSTRCALKDAYQGILNYLEEEIGAKKIIGYAHSIGGGVQADAFATHPLKEDVQYLCVWGRTFSTLAQEAYSLYESQCKLLGGIFRLGVQLPGWNMNPAKVVKTLKFPQIIIQTCKTGKDGKCKELRKHPPRRRKNHGHKSHKRIGSVSDIVDDEMIAAKVSLAKTLLEDETCPKKNKLFLGIKEMHNDSLGKQTISCLAKAINTFLNQ